MRTAQGFTLIELILYVAIMAIVSTALIPFAWNIIGTGVKSAAEQEVFSQARVVSERIKYEIRNATGINNVTSSSISLAKSEASLNPTVIDFLAGKIRISQGGGGAVNLNSSDTNMTSLTFTNYTSADNKTKHIQFIFTMEDNYTGLRQEYNVPPITVEGSVEIRSN
ncbi:MAG: hypothetical protein UU73_C0003G0013 [Candidatus Daviesbacteria bacterium GW2011_GWA1_41_61]|uniref:Type II secretion system protein n=1 Tax=Candidatus Daviesbacteria bacterium GW2011_GWA2_40_9 TaxID=1618424 RepID=A0A0G0TZC0_9BACT|nr:MAG: hypothetical protein UU26_C0005G0042 [Candidatus Daviesbacteria bacterium GW2011_GWC1_40_9]KKR82173.1 MAG: hypothetical protein UU29_C0017G0009 [Candidatus Daviesbacteria bacterium GW2011_GWA2_40_9]KKR93635.1 MAG: hypothetical protein UU44_C0002G0296 [Candidatus Daviesbacteria bacterium GW2011_GWB1_41_15]KKS14814.1 MAG: hypothetical protein UU73_C0003G0013 [Candidatus Daviesbacteria bacterium GW2011_GWA1_41_61]